MDDARGSSPVIGCGTISELQNPITRTVARIVPPLEITSEEELYELAAKWDLYCLVAWMDSRRDPNPVTGLREWCEPGGQWR
jgi:hypothetical protein